MTSAQRSELTSGVRVRHVRALPVAVHGSDARTAPLPRPRVIVAGHLPGRRYARRDPDAIYVLPRQRRIERNGVGFNFKPVGWRLAEVFATRVGLIEWDDIEMVYAGDDPDGGPTNIRLCIQLWLRRNGAFLRALGIQVKTRHWIGFEVIRTTVEPHQRAAA